MKEEAHHNRFTGLIAQLPPSKRDTIEEVRREGLFGSPAQTPPAASVGRW